VKNHCISSLTAVFPGELVPARVPLLQLFHKRSFCGLVECQPDIGSVTKHSSNQWPGLVFSLSTTGRTTERALFLYTRSPTTPVPYFRTYRPGYTVIPRVIQFFACQKEVLLVMQGCGVYKIILTRFVHHVSLGIFNTISCF